MITTRFAVVAAAGLVAAACTRPPVDDELPPPPDATWQLTWHDEFDGAADSEPDPTRWGHDIGGGGWGNGQLEFNTDQLANAHLDGNGALVITALRQRYNESDYTSARLSTADHFTQQYGRFEARIRLPVGQGIWPAFWLLGADIASAGWPECGEVDIMEARGDEPSTNHGSAHGPGYSGVNPHSAPYHLPGARFADDFHVFAAEWGPGELHWFVDGHHYHAVTAASLPPEHRWVFDDRPMFVLLDVAVGGTFAGEVDDSIFPQSMVVDYVRVYEKVEGP